MRLITELFDTVSVVAEAKEDGKKNLFIEGVFMQYNNEQNKQPNRNGRWYAEEIIKPEVTRYVKECVNTKRAYGELNHPQGPQINLDRVCHLIERLEFQRDGTITGKARVLDTPMGDTVRGILEGGGSLGVSCRGLGSLKENRGIMEVQNDFRLVTAADVVADPSAQRAFVNGVMENVEYFFNEKTGEYCQVMQKEVHKLTPRQIEEKKADFFARYLKTL
jgi:hypothetical protein